MLRVAKGLQQSTDSQIAENSAPYPQIIVRDRTETDTETLDLGHMFSGDLSNAFTRRIVSDLKLTHLMPGTLVNKLKAGGA